MKFRAVKYPEIADLEYFIKSAGSSLSSFRYFNKRPFSVIQNHACTWILLDPTPVAYGHLDVENNQVWLGISVLENQKGRGYGQQMMQKLIESAQEKNIHNIRLCVDVDNTPAQALYAKVGFKRLEQEGSIYFYELIL